MEVFYVNGWLISCRVLIKGFRGQLLRFFPRQPREIEFICPISACISWFVADHFHSLCSQKSYFFPLAATSSVCTTISIFLSFPRARNRLEMMERKPTEEKRSKLDLQAFGYRMLFFSFSASRDASQVPPSLSPSFRLFISVCLPSLLPTDNHRIFSTFSLNFATTTPHLTTKFPHPFLIFSTFQNSTIIKNSTSSARILIASLNRRFVSADFCKFFFALIPTRLIYDRTCFAEKQEIKGILSALDFMLFTSKSLLLFLLDSASYVYNHFFIGLYFVNNLQCFNTRIIDFTNFALRSL